MGARNTVLAGVAGVALVIAAGVLVLVRGRPADDAVREANGAPVPASTPKVVPLEPHEAAMALRANPWPFEDFQADIDAARRPAREMAIVEREKAVWGHNGRLEERHFSIAVTDQRLQDIIPVLAKEFYGTPTEIFTGEPHLPDHVRFTFDLREVTVFDVFHELERLSDGIVKTEIVPRGMIFGSQNAVIQARLDAREWEAQVRARKSRPDDPLLLAGYRPDFEGAHVGIVARDIHDKTGIEVIVGRELWTKPLTLTWRADPMPLRETLDGLGERLRADWYLYDGRIFLLAR